MSLRAHVLTLSCLAFGACGGGPDKPPPAREYTDPGFVTGGGVRLYYALTLVSDLPPAIAGSYAVVQSPNLALLTITLAPETAVGIRRLAANELDAAAVTLLGERQQLALRRVDDTGGPTYLAEVAVRDREPITIEIRARAIADGPEITARWTREFDLE